MQAELVEVSATARDESTRCRVSRENLSAENSTPDRADSIINQNCPAAVAAPGRRGIILIFISLLQPGNGAGTEIIGTSGPAGRRIA
jgi:hypothetical protein